MIKNKQIGIGIVHCQSAPGSSSIGYNKVFTSDDEQWSSLIDDTGSVFSYVKWEHDVILRMIKFVQDGWYMCSMKQVAGRDDEYRASWVFFPTSIELSQKEIKTIVESAESQIKERDFDAHYLQELASKYNNVVVDSPKYSIPSNQSGYAYRYDNGQMNLYDLYSCMYQKEFTKYEWVLLMPKDSLIIKGGDNIKDISDMNIIESHIISPIKNPDGFIAYLSDGSKFSSPIRIMDGEILGIEWRKEGYLHVPKKVKNQEDLELKSSEYRRYYWLKSFSPVDLESKKPVSGCYLNFKNGEVRTDNSGQQFLIIKESDVPSVKFTPEVEGYVKEEFDMDFTDKKLGDTIKFELTPESHRYEFVLKLNSDIVRQKNIDVKEISFSISSQKKLSDSDVKILIPGYTCVGSVSDKFTNYLREIPIQSSPKDGKGGATTGGNGHSSNGTNTKKNDKNNGKVVGHQPNGNNRHHQHAPWWQYGLIGLILIATIGLGYALYKFFIYEEPSQHVEWGQPKSEWEKAFEYLSEHDVKWDKSEMETFSELKGVYTMIKDFQFKELKAFIDKHQDLQSLEPWNRLYEIVSNNNNKKGTFNTSNGSIDVEEYLKTDFKSKEDVVTSTIVSETDVNTSTTNSSIKDSNTSASSTNSNKVNSSNTNNPSSTNTQNDLN